MGQTIDCLRTEPRDEQAATCVLTKAIRRHGVPETITIDGSAANEAAITRDNEEHGTAIDIRPMKYLHTMVEQDHRGVTRPRLGFKSCAAAQDTLVGIELRHMLKKQPLVVEEGDEALTPAEQFYALAASSLHRQGQLFLQYLPEQNLRHNRKCHFGATRGPRDGRQNALRHHLLIRLVVLDLLIVDQKRVNQFLQSTLALLGEAQQAFVGFLRQFEHLAHELSPFL
jgi:hypothetical protein